MQGVILQANILHVKDLTVSFIQCDIHWRDWEGNKRSLDTLIDGLPNTDILILPETFPSGFTMDPVDVAQSMQGPTVRWMSEHAISKDCHIMGSLVIREDDAYYNRLVACHPDGGVSFYNKRHLFTYAGEGEQFAQGEHVLEFAVKSWQVRPLICYDLRFPVWSRNTTDYDLLIYTANWPSARVDAWMTLLKARAIENQCYVVGVNRTGSDGNGFEYPGSSAVFDMSGASLYTSDDAPDVATVRLSASNLKDYRKQYNFLADRDSYIIN